ncbi:DUF4381 domain-containing protein [Candidatus Nitrospira neomarina]|uniref:DUF4381 domain-containing protein n=1 Tax=Candidatus Nitrospira neomarina TaxID=3020899 RepID=A0AA96GH37_9BACT|nr:DUF4381 domain-containing protein [Candidatus Nitrospira neomarina]WNM61132.1 DUF4381 domain-containing protein [Candidatus Nitrospira neomarina]
MPTASSPLQDLRDVHLPPPISLWPPAPGWWITVGLVIMAVMLFLWILRNRRRKQSWRLAMNELSAIKQHYDTHRDDQWLIQRLSIMIRRYAIASFPRTEVAGLAGISWLQFLDRSGRTNQFTDGVGRLFSSGPYQQQTAVSAAELVPLVEQWIRQVTPPTGKSTS